MKKLVSIFLVVCLCLSLSACTDINPTVVTAANDAQVQTVTTTTAGEELSTTVPTTTTAQKKTTTTVLTTSKTQKATVTTTVTTTEEPQQESEMVWVPNLKKGKYHSNKKCSGMKSPVQLEKEEAVRLGFGPCSKCYR